MGTASSGAPRSRTLCHGWSEPGAAAKWHQPKFCTASGPSGPEGIQTRNRILRAGNFMEGRRGISRKRGSGGGPAGAVRRPRDSPGDPLVSFPSLGKKLAPQGETLQDAARRVVAPYGRHDPRRTGGSGTRPYGDPRLFPIHGGRGKPLPYGMAGKHSVAENRRAGRPVKRDLPFTGGTHPSAGPPPAATPPAPPADSR